MEESVIDLNSKGEYPASALSNFAQHPFEFEGLKCKSMESLLQSFKFSNPTIQSMICRDSAPLAKQRGEAQDSAWKAEQILYHKGVQYLRKERVYEQLLDRAYSALFLQSKDFREALKASGDATLIHTIGKTDPTDTVLTVDEFCSRLMRLREDL